MVDDTTLCSIRNLVEYLHDDEERHHSECDEKGRKNHIYNDVLIVKEWLDGIPDIPTKICPVCKQRTLEIHGEGITSDGRHYPMENCTNCGYAPKSSREPLHSDVKKWLISFLESWDQTFDEETEIPALIEKIRNDETMTDDEHYELLFHLWQRFYDV
jgi:hypothetical protein